MYKLQCRRHYANKHISLWNDSQKRKEMNIFSHLSDSGSRRKKQFLQHYRSFFFLLNENIFICPFLFSSFICLVKVQDKGTICIFYYNILSLSFVKTSRIKKIEFYIFHLNAYALASATFVTVHSITNIFYYVSLLSNALTLY